MIDELKTIIRFTLKEHIRHRVFLSLFLYGFLMLGGGALISSLAITEHGRMMMDFGLAGIEFLGLTTIVFVTVNLVLTEIESRTIYLILSRPVPRGTYILGRFLGTTLAVALSMGAMAVMHALVLTLYNGVSMGPAYLTCLVCALAKLAVVGSLALVLSIATTSAASAMTFTLFFWLLGHFTSELNFLLNNSRNIAVQALFWTLANLAPNFSYFNYRDFFLNAPAPPAGWFLAMVSYAFCYSGVCLWLSSFLFSNKEY